jgi:hypothetical protein
MKIIIIRKQFLKVVAICETYDYLNEVNPVWIDYFCEQYMAYKESERKRIRISVKRHFRKCLDLGLIKWQVENIQNPLDKPHRGQYTIADPRDIIAFRLSK